MFAIIEEFDRADSAVFEDTIAERVLEVAEELAADEIENFLDNAEVSYQFNDLLTALVYGDIKREKNGTVYYSSQDYVVGIGPTRAQAALAFVKAKMMCY